MKRLIATALIACVAIGVLAWAIIRHVNNKQDAEWCHDNGYTNYATKDGFCVGAGGKLIKVGRTDSE
jgi:DhnA family fructose-bisphosphate aldolase class Ia